MGKIRYQFDEHIANVAAIGLRSNGIDAITAAEAGLRSAADAVLLAHAHTSSRVVVTRDDDFLRLNAVGQPHSGIVFVGKRIRTIGELIEMLLLVHEAYSDEEMLGHVEFV